jgi:hypothetical protein
MTAPSIGLEPMACSRLVLVINLAAGLPLIYALIYALLLAAREYNLCSFDYVFGKKS